MIKPDDYADFEYERMLNNAMGTHGERVYTECEYKRAVRSRFSEEFVKDLRAGAARLGVKRGHGMTVDELLEAIAAARWVKLPARFKLS